MDMYIMTRGTHIDYMFLGSEPQKAWWTNFREWTAFEYPTIIFVPDKRGSKLYLSGIPSQRKDRVKTPIRYTLIFEKLFKEDIERILNLVKSWLNDIISSDGDPISSEVGEFLDKKFTKEYIDNILLRLKKITKDNEKISIQDEITNKISDIFEYNYTYIEAKNDHWVCVSGKEKKEWITFVKEIEQMNTVVYLNLTDERNIHNIFTIYQKILILTRKEDKIMPIDNNSIYDKIKTFVSERMEDGEKVIKRYFMFIFLAVSIILNLILFIQKHSDNSEINFIHKYPYVSEIEISFDPYIKNGMSRIDLKMLFENTDSVPIIKNQEIETEKEWDANRQVLSFQIPQKSDIQMNYNIKISNIKNNSGLAMKPFKIIFYKKKEK